jgi:translation initiation factor IF-3
LRFDSELSDGEYWKPVWFQKEIIPGDYDDVQLLLRDQDGNIKAGDPIKVLVTQQLEGRIAAAQESGRRVVSRIFRTFDLGWATFRHWLKR